MTDLRIDPSTELRRAALELFARDGYDATSLQDVADQVGYTKANVLYHFKSKQALLEAALGPAIAEFESLALACVADDGTVERVSSEAMLDFLFAHQQAVSIFINQASALRDQPLVQRANELITRYSAPDPDDGDVHAIRTSIAIAGAAYVIAQRNQFGLFTTVGDDEFRARLELAVRSIADLDPTGR